MKPLMYLKSMAYELYRAALNRLSLPFNKYELWRKTAKTLGLSKEAHQRLEWIIYYYVKTKGNASLTIRHFVNHTLVPRAQASGNLLVVELLQMARRSKPLQKVVENISPDILKLLYEPRNYVGKAREKTLEIVTQARKEFAAD